MQQEEYEAYQMQDAIQQGMYERQQSVSAPQLAEEMQRQQAVLVEQTNPKKIVEDVMLRLRGVERKGDGTLFAVATPKMNKIGLERIWFILESHINQNVILSHLEEEEIRHIILSLSDDLVDCLALNWRSFGIRDKTDLDDINNSVLCNIYFALKRAEGQNEKNWLGKISIENISAGNRFPSMKKESFWSKFKI